MKLYEKMKTGVYVIAEMSANHAGNLENALQIVEEAKKAGADCLKIQTYTADTMTIDCDNEYFKISGGLWNGYKLYDLYKDAYTPWKWQKAIKEKCNEVGIDFLSTPFDKTSVDFLEELGVDFYKVASFELVDLPLIEYIAKKGKPMIISCGMGSLEEISEAVEACYSAGNKNIVLLKCTSEYPANYSDMNVATIRDMSERFSLPLGISDHSMGSLAAVVAVTIGARVIEKHFCLSREIKNPDSEFSMEPHELKQMIEDVNNTILIMGMPTYELTQKEQTSLVFRRSVFAVRDIGIGEKFTEYNIRVIRPGYGMKPKYYKDALGSEATHNIKKGQPLTFDDQ